MACTRSTAGLETLGSGKKTTVVACNAVSEGSRDPHLEGMLAASLQKKRKTLRNCT